MSKVIGVPGILLGNYLAQSRAMFLAIVYLRLSQCLASRQTFICAADRFIFLVQIEKWSFFMSICNISQRNHDYAEQIRRLKKNWCAKEKPLHTILYISTYLYIF
jgi:hypothetical protein